ncbi:MAG: ATPase [Gemmatimonas sp.]|nr:ATPase [Gemmatimonas sp.]
MTARTDEVSMLIRAPKAIIYRALLDADARLAWLPPDGMTGRIERFDPRVGGGYRMVLTYRDPTGNAGKSAPDSDVVEARFVEFVPDERVVESIAFESEDAAIAGTMTMTWILMAVDDGTEVRVTAAQVPEGISAEDHRAGMRSSLRNLAAFVEP